MIKSSGKSPVKSPGESPRSPGKRAGDGPGDGPGESSGESSGEGSGESSRESLESAVVGSGFGGRGVGVMPCGGLLGSNRNTRRPGPGISCSHGTSALKRAGGMDERRTKRV